MRKVLDLGELHKQLRQTEEHEPHFDEELKPLPAGHSSSATGG